MVQDESQQFKHSPKKYFATIAAILFVLGLIVIQISTMRVSNNDDNEYSIFHNWHGFLDLSLKFECQSPTWCDTYFEGSDKIQEEIYRLQHPPNCSEARFFVIPDEYVSGMGSSLHQKAFTLGIGVATNRTVIFQDGAPWVFSHCTPPTFECYFEPVTNCNTSLHAVGWQNAPELTNFVTFQEERILKISSIGQRKDLGYVWADWVPSQYEGRDRFWWHAQVTKYLLRPNELTKKIVRETQNSVFPNGVIPHPLISMYVRHGDKWKEAPPTNFSTYMAIVENITRIADIRDIYIGTEDPAVIKEAERIQKNGKYRFYYIKTNRDNSAPLDILKTSEADELVRVSLSDLFIQVQGDVFIGTRSSNWCRLIDEIRKVQGKARIPFFSPEPPEYYYWD